MFLQNIAQFGTYCTSTTAVDIGKGHGGETGLGVVVKGVHEIFLSLVPKVLLLVESGALDAKGIKVALVVSRFNSLLTERLLALTLGKIALEEYRGQPERLIGVRARPTVTRSGPTNGAGELPEKPARLRFLKL